MGCLYRLDFSPNSAFFKILGPCPLHRVKQAMRQPCPMKWLGIARALVVGLYTLKKRKNLTCMDSFKRCWPLKTGFDLHRVKHVLSIVIILPFLQVCHFQVKFLQVQPDVTMTLDKTFFFWWSMWWLY